MNMFREYNPHPKGLLVGDCVKRAIVVVTGMAYEDVKWHLNAYKKMTGAKAFNSNRNPHLFIKNELDAKPIAVPEGTTVRAFCAAHPRGRYILDMRAHWVGVYNADYYDTWDCGGETVACAYRFTTKNYSPPDLG